MASETIAEDEELQLDFGELDITTDEVDLNGLTDDMASFVDNPLVAEALQKGDIRKYSIQIESDLRDVEKASIQDYINESDNLASLHTQIRDCDEILEDMEGMLTAFQSDLGNISSEIKHLQDQSLGMNIKIKNRKEAREKLAEFIDTVVVPPELIVNICESEVNENYLEYLAQLNRKIDKGCVPGKGSQTDSRARSDVENQLEKLRLKAVARVREFLLQRIFALKKPKTNIQILQQNVLLKFKFFTEFLQQHSPEGDMEVRHAYIDTMGKLLHANFKGYIGNLLKLQFDLAGKHDLIGVEEQGRGGFFGKPKHKGNVFSLGVRGSILDEINQPAIIYHVAQQKNQKFPFESLFRSMTCLLMDTATSEFLFINDFFGKKDAFGMFNHVFAKSISLFVETIENFLFSCYDGIGVLLMVRINHHHQLIMTRRRLPCLDSFCDRVNMLLWPRFKMIFDLNLNSLRQANPKALVVTDIQPHYVMRRYAEFSASILQLNQKYEDEMLVVNLAQLRREAENLLFRLATELTDKERQTLFLINNYDLILTVFNEAGVLSQDTSHFEEQLGAQVHTFVENDLTVCFGRLIGFVKHVEPRVATASPQEMQAVVNLAEMETIVKEFNANWKAGIEHINNNVMRYFSNFKNGTDILQQVLSQLVLYYTRFQEIIKKCCKQAPFAKEVITIPVIMHEIRKYLQGFEN